MRKFATVPQRYWRPAWGTVHLRPSWESLRQQLVNGLVLMQWAANLP